MTQGKCHQWGDEHHHFHLAQDEAGTGVRINHSADIH